MSYIFNIRHKYCNIIYNVYTCMMYNVYYTLYIIQYADAPHIKLFTSFTHSAYIHYTI